MTFVILTGGIDLSVGSVVALSTMIAARTLDLGWSPYLVMAAVLVVGTVLGTLMGLLIHYFDIQPFIATLAGMFLARGLCYLISVESIAITDDTFSRIAFATINLPGGYYIDLDAWSSRWPSSPSPRTCWPAPASAAPSTRSAATRARPC